MPSPHSSAGEASHETASRRSLSSTTPVTQARLAAGVRNAAAESRSLAEAAQSMTAFFHGEFRDSAPLVRVFVMLPYRKLPPAERAFARAIAARHGASLDDATPVLTLLGTSGAEPEWNDRRSSAGHVAIPLVGASFVQSVPMIAALLSELGLQLSWFDVPKEVFSRKLLGGFNGLFYVADARTARDAQGRAVIPARDFVDRYGIRTVFGVGGTYVDDSVLASIIFTRETLSRAQVEQFSFLASTFKTETTRFVIGGDIFPAAR